MVMLSMRMRARAGRSKGFVCPICPTPLVGPTGGTCKRGSRKHPVNREKNTMSERGEGWPALAVRRSGRQVIVVADFGEGIADDMVNALPDGEWADAGSPVEVIVASKLLGRIADAAPEPLATVADGCRYMLLEAVEDLPPNPRLN